MTTTYSVKFTKVEKGSTGLGDVVEGILTTRESNLQAWIDYWIWGSRKTPYLILEDKIVLDTDLGGASDWMDAGGLLPADVRLWLCDRLTEHKVRTKHFVS